MNSKVSHAFKKAKKLSFNTLDVLIFVALLLPATFLFENLGIFQGTLPAHQSLIIIFLPVYGFYIGVLRDPIMNHPLAIKILPPKTAVSGFHVFGFLGALFSYIGALMVILTFYFSLTLKQPAWEYSLRLAEVKANKQAKNNAQMQMIGMMADAEKLPASEVPDDAEMADIDNIEKELEAQELKKLEQYKEDMLAEMENEHLVRSEQLRQERYQRSLFFLFVGIIMMFIGLLLDRIRREAA